jgi:ribonuclease E
VPTKQKNERGRGRGAGRVQAAFDESTVDAPRETAVEASQPSFDAASVNAEQGVGVSRPPSRSGLRNRGRRSSTREFETTVETHEPDVVEVTEEAEAVVVEPDVDKPKKRVSQISRELGITSKEVLQRAHELGSEATTANSSLTADIYEQIAAPSPVDENLSAELDAALTSAKTTRGRRGRRGVAPEERDAALAELTEAIAETAGGRREDESDDKDDTESGEEGASRRRRRRGGRKRHKNERSSDGGEGSTSDDEGWDNTGGYPADDGASEDEEEGSGHRRRRRLRRRRGEDSSGSDDDTSDVVVKVREPRQARGDSSNDEVTGIEGSTRIQAKRQRRKDSRSSGRRAPILTEAEFLARRESVERRMVVRQHPDYTQLAVLEDGILVEHYVDRASASSLIGNVYLGKVQNVLPSMEAVFIDIGRGRNAVLYAGEVDWEAYGEQGADRKVEVVFKPGQSVLVQVSKDPVGAKGARLTGHVSLPGRYVVYSPKGHLSGVSRKLSDAERLRLKTILLDQVDDGASVVIRTAAESATVEELAHDVERLRAQWEVIDRKVSAGSAPQLLYSEPELTLRIVRDLFTPDFTQLIVCGDGGPTDSYENISAYVNHIAPTLAERLVRWDATEQGDPFAKYRIDEQIAKALERKVFLPSGGSLVIDRTEAMTVIDVNTGRFIGSGGNLEETVTKNNLEAAEEIVRQLRLRDLGGIVVVDFIDMVLPSNRELLQRRLVECLGRDRTRHQVSEVTSLGLVQLTRKRIGTGLAEAFTEECEHCGGRGYVRCDEPVATQAPADGGERTTKTTRGGGRRKTSS